jgi:hypothetical protein
MKRPIFFTILSGAALAAIVLGLTTARAPGPVPSSARVQPLPPAPPPAVPTEISSAAPADQPGGNPEPLSSPVDSPSAVTPAGESLPMATNLPVADIGRELSEIAATNPAAALELAARLDPSQHPGDLMEDIVQQWANGDPLAAAAWAKLNTSGEEQSLLLQRVGFVLSQTSPVDAAEFVQAEIPQGPVQDEAIMTVVNQWGNKDLAAAASWVKTFPEGPLQQRAVVELEGIENYRQALALSQN